MRIQILEKYNELAIAQLEFYRDLTDYLMERLGWRNKDRK